jgi:hypothetical protein
MGDTDGVRRFKLTYLRASATPREPVQCTQSGFAVSHEAPASAECRPKFISVAARGARMCRCAGVPACMTKEAHDPGGQLFFYLSASLSRRRDSVDHRCIARKGIPSIFTVFVIIWQEFRFCTEREKSGKGRGCRTAGHPPHRSGFLGNPRVPSSVSGIRTPQHPLLPVWEKGAGGMRGKRRGNAANRALLLRTLPLRASQEWVFGEPPRAILRFRHQDAPTPPSPRVGEGGRGDEGQSLPSLRQALEARLEEAQILRFVHHA